MLRIENRKPRVCGRLARIKPFDYVDEQTGDTVSISVSPFYSKLTINGRDYFFVRETGEFDGTAITILPDGPILIFARE